MPYETHWESKGIRWVFSGAVTDDDLIRSNEEIYDDPRFEKIRYQIADFQKVERYTGHSDTVQRVADMDRAQAARNPDVKVAIVVGGH